MLEKIVIAKQQRIPNDTNAVFAVFDLEFKKNFTHKN
jgi:hypothetical protein